MRYRKRPVTVDAWRWEGDGEPEFPAWLQTPDVRYSKLAGGPQLRGRIFITTLEGQMAADPGDWIIKGVKGEFYPCKPDIFLMAYEPVL